MAKSIVVRIAFVIAVVITAGLCGVSRGIGAPARKCADEVRDIHVDGDLMYMKAAEDFAALLAQASRSGATRLRVSVVCARARLDVIVAMARAIRAAGIPVHVEIADRSPREGRVDPATRSPMEAKYLLLAASANSASIRARQPFRAGGRVGSGDDAKQDPAIQDAVELTIAGLTSRGVDAERAGDLARAALDPHEALWLVLGPEDQVESISRQESSTNRCMELVTAQPGAVVFMLSAQDAARAGFAFAPAGAPEEAKPGNVSELPWRNPLEIRGQDYSRRADRAAQRLPSIDSLLMNIDEVLNLPDPARRSVSKDTYRAAGRRGLEKVAQTEAQIAALEEDLRDFPELLRTAPPGQTEVGAKPSSFASRWRSMIQSRKDKLAKLRQKSEEFARQ